MLYFLLFCDVDQDILLRLPIEPEEFACGHRDVCCAEDLLDVGHVLGLCDGLALQGYSGGLARFFPLLLGLDLHVRL